MKRINGGAGFASGVIGILYICGVLTDPTMEKLNEIKNLILKQNQVLDAISKQISNVADSLAKQGGTTIYQQRANAAQRCLQNWKKFEDKLNALLKQQDAYETRVNYGISEWSEGGKYRQDLSVYYTNYKVSESVTEKTQTFSTTNKLTLDKSDSGETIIKDDTVILPKDYVDMALEGYKYNVSSYRDDISNRLATQVKTAMEDEELLCSTAFKNAWDAMTGTQKDAKALELGKALLNSASFIVAYNKTNESEALSVEISNIVSDMAVILKEAIAPGSGVSENVNSIIYMSSFEGEAKQDLIKAFSGVTLLLTEYNTFAMSVGSMCKYVNKERSAQLRDKWAYDIQTINKMQKATIKNKDNFCYLTNTLISLEDYTVYGKSYMQVDEGTFVFTPNSRYVKDGQDKYVLVERGGTKKIDKVDTLGGANLVAMRMIWGQKNDKKIMDEKTGKEFIKFLSQYSTKIPSDYTGVFLTGNDQNDSGGTFNFNLTEGIPMTTYLCSKTSKPYYFSNGGTTNVMTNSDRITNTKLHDQARAETYDPLTNNISTSRITSRATYVKAKSTWFYDETWLFGDKTAKNELEKVELYDSYKGIMYYLHNSKDIQILKSTPVANDGDINFKENEYNPFEFLENIASVSDFGIYYKTQENVDLLTFEDWQAKNVENIDKMSSESKLEEYVNAYIENFVQEAKEEGITLEITDSQKAELLTAIKTLISEAESRFTLNSNLKGGTYIDPFDIYEDKEQMKELALEVLPDTEIADDGQTVIPIENMITSAVYDVTFGLEIEETDEEYQVYPKLIYCINPVLVTWNDITKEITRYDISDEVMEELGLTMRVRFDSSDAEENNVATITHYDDEMNVVEELTADIAGEGGNRYAEVSVTSCSPFAVSYSTVNKNTDSAKSGTGRTGDDTNALPFIILGGVAILGVGCAIVVKRKKED